MNSEIKVSIILPTLNGSKFIHRTIESVISQTYSNWELLVINDGSNDNTENIIKEFIAKDSRIIYLKNESNLGIQKTSNLGLKRAKGEYIARIDDDDEWVDKDKLKKQVEFLNDNLDYVLVGTGVIVVDENGDELFRYLTTNDDVKIRNKILSKNIFINSSVIFRRDSAIKLGGYSEKEIIKHIEDYDLCLKLGLVGKFYNLPYFATKYTSRKNSISSNNKLDQFRKNIILIKEFKDKYPHYLQSVILSYLRLFFYKIFSFVPFESLQYWIIKFYKKF